MGSSLTTSAWGPALVNGGTFGGTFTAGILSSRLDPTVQGGGGFQGGSSGSVGANTFTDIVKPVERIENGDWNLVNTRVGEMRSTSNWVGDPAITVRIDGQLYLVDGHHRVHAAMEAGVEVNYTEVPFADLPKYNLYYSSESQIVRAAQQAGGWSRRN